MCTQPTATKHAINMSTALPVAADDQLVGTCFVVSHDAAQSTFYFATCLHIFAQTKKIQIALPPHGGNCAAPQTYPLLQGVGAADAEIVASDPFSDLAILRTQPGQLNANSLALPKIAATPHCLPVGSPVVVLGYPFATIGSMLETWTMAHVSAQSRRQLSKNFLVDELVLSMVTHPGASGSPVFGHKDGVLYGIVRGTLAPPGLLHVGNVPIGTDTSIAFASSAHYLHDLINNALGKGKT